MVKPVVDKELCISCGNCIEICPEVFKFDDDEKADVIDPKGCGSKCDCDEAAASCPTNAITVE